MGNNMSTHEEPCDIFLVAEIDATIGKKMPNVVVDIIKEYSLQQSPTCEEDISHITGMEMEMEKDDIDANQALLMLLLIGTMKTT